MSKIELRNVKKSYAKNDPVIENLSLEIEEGSFTVLLGPSGCGKSTILRMIAGLEKVDGGSIWIDGKDIVNVEPGKRGAAMVFQNYALYPTMTAWKNIEFGVKNMKVPKEERAQRIRESLAMVGLEDYSNHKPRELSGGQCQRLALARAIVKKPRVFLMDEPLSNLDAQLRTQIRADLVQLHKQLGATFVFVTHDQVEAMSMATNIVLLEKGEIRQEDEPLALYNKPANLFSAQFIGSPSMNITPLDIFDDLQTPPGAVFLGFRPENAQLSVSQSSIPDNAICTKVRLLSEELLGDHALYKVEVGETPLYVKRSDSINFTQENLVLGIAEENLFYFDNDGNRIDTCRNPSPQTEQEG